MKIILGLFLGFSACVLGQKQWTLAECIAHAKQQNLQVKQQLLATKYQEINLKMAKNDYLPNISANLGQNINLSQNALGGELYRNHNFGHQLSLNAGMVLFNHGKIKKNIQKNQLELEATHQELEALQLNLSVQISQVYLQILLQKELVEINKNNLDFAQKMLKKAKISTEVGSAAPSVYYEAQANVSRDLQQYESAKIEVARACFNLAQWLQLPDDKNFDVATPTPMPLAALPQYDELFLQENIASQAAIKGAKLRIEAAEKQIEIQKTAYWPTVSANVMLGDSYKANLGPLGPLSSPNVGFWEQYKHNFTQQVSLNASIPIFNQGNTRQLIQQAKINQEVAHNALEQQTQKLKQSLKQLIFDAENHQKRYQMAIDAEKATSIALDFAQKSYDAGKTNIYDLNMARNSHLQAQSVAVQSKYSYWFAVKCIGLYFE
jgi:outer membrane protein